MPIRKGPRPKGPRFVDVKPGVTEQREWKAAYYDDQANGKTAVGIVCPFCETVVRAATWSLAGGGKRCTGDDCYALFGSSGAAYDWVKP